MNIVGRRIIIHLERRETLSLGLAQHLEVRCLRGTLWVTQPGRRDDLLMEAGEQATLTGRGTAVLEALRGQALCLLRAIAP